MTHCPRRHPLHPQQREVAGAWFVAHRAKLRPFWAHFDRARFTALRCLELPAAAECRAAVEALVRHHAEAPLRAVRIRCGDGRPPDKRVMRRRLFSLLPGCGTPNH